MFQKHVLPFSSVHYEGEGGVSVCVRACVCVCVRACVCVLVRKQTEHTGTAVGNDIAELKLWEEHGKIARAAH
jgi:hypothetical protein